MCAFVTHTFPFDAVASAFHEIATRKSEVVKAVVEL
jgi:threonine dehydrogenase-like Zn-dependent dehydrogenase